jgi:hypothetical protein
MSRIIIVILIIYHRNVVPVRYEQTYRTEFQIKDETMDNVQSKSKSHYDRQSVGQSVLVSGAHLGPATNFTFSLKFLLDSCGFVIL